MYTCSWGLFYGSHLSWGLSPGGGISEGQFQRTDSHTLDNNNITASLIKEVSEGIIQPLVYIYNLSIETGIFPDNLKIAKVIPAYKKR